MSAQAEDTREGRGDWRERQDRQTDRLTDIQTDRQTGRQTERHTDRHIEDRQAADRQTGRQQDQQIERQTYRQTAKETDRQERRAGRQAGRHAESEGVVLVSWFPLSVRMCILVNAYLLSGHAGQCGILYSYLEEGGSPDYIPTYVHPICTRCTL